MEQELYKFRAWCHTNDDCQIMVENFQFLAESTEDSFFFETLYEESPMDRIIHVMQEFPFIDGSEEPKNFHEYDIISFSEFKGVEHNRVGIVHRDKNGFVVITANYAGLSLTRYDLTNILSGRRFKVIGNIYETPELTPLSTQFQLK